MEFEKEHDPKEIHEHEHDHEHCDHEHPEEHLLSDEVILAASLGDEDCLQRIVDYYQKDIDTMATRAQKVDGKTVVYVDEEVRRELTDKIIRATLNFVPEE